MRSSTRLALCALSLLALLVAACGERRAASTEPLPLPEPGQPYVEPGEPAWTFCTNAGAPCDFTGFRDVRLGPANGPYVIAQAYHEIPCAAYGFGDQDPAPGQSLHCDYGPIKLVTMANPSPGMGGLAATIIVPVGAPGTPDQQVMATGEQPSYVDGSGAFRTTCSLAAVRFDDPVVYPGKPGASHLHYFFGNTGVDANTTAQSLTTTGNSTCRGGTLNRTAYWVPAIVDTRTGKVVPPDEATFYYKTGYNIDPARVAAFPAGLRMIAGNKAATAPQDYVTWSCRHADGSFTDNAAGTVPTNCRKGDQVRLSIIFPQCWDGKNLDAPDHKSHMAYPLYRNTFKASACPTTHPVTLPEITEHFDYPVVDAAAPAYWRLSSDMYDPSLKGGFSAHADWFNGWNPQTMQTIVTQCLNKGVDCGVGSIGNGTTLF